MSTGNKMECNNFITNAYSSTFPMIFLSTRLVFQMTSLVWIIFVALNGSRFITPFKCSAESINPQIYKKRPELQSPSGAVFYEDDHDRFLSGPNAPFPFRPEVVIRPPVSPHGPNRNFYPVAFSATRAHPLARGCTNGECVIVFENVLPTVSGGFERKSGVFNCNVPGLYFFTFSGISTAHNSFRLALFHNDHEVISAYGQANGFGMASNSIILQLQQGNKICLKLLEGELYESEAPFRAYTSFSGFLLQSKVMCCHPTENSFIGLQGGHSEFIPEVENIPNEFGPRNLPPNAENGTAVEEIK